MTKVRITGLALVSCLAVAIGGCGGGGGLAAFDYISISPADFTARPDDEIQFRAYGQYNDGAAGREITPNVTWASTDDSVGTISPQGDFVVEGEGTCEISATYDNLEPASTQVTVESAPFLPTASWYPFGFGYQWTYTGTQVQPGQVGPAQETTLTISINQQEVRDGVVWWELMVKGSEAGVPPSYMYLRHTEDGLFQWQWEAEPIPRLIEPLMQGHSWLDPNSAEHRFTIERTDETVVVPAGAYDNCIRLREYEGRGDPPFDVLVWFAEGVGIVKDQVWVDGEMVEEQELTEVQFGVP